MNVVTKSWIIVTLTIGCKKITNSRQHSEPIEFEELSRQLRQRSRGKEGNTRFANEGTFAFCFWVSLWRWKARYVREIFHFLKFVINFLKGVVSVYYNFRNTGQPGRTNSFDRCFLVVDRCAARRLIELSRACEVTNLTFINPTWGNKSRKHQSLPKCLRKLWTVYMLELMQKLVILCINYLPFLDNLNCTGS